MSAWHTALAQLFLTHRARLERLVRPADRRWRPHGGSGAGKLPAPARLARNAGLELKLFWLASAWATPFITGNGAWLWWRRRAWRRGMNAHPRRATALMGLSTVLGLIGVMVLDGWWMLAALLLASLPPAIRLLGYCRARAI